MGPGSHGPAPWSPVISSPVTLGFLCDPCRLESPLHSGCIPQQGETEPTSWQARPVLRARPFLPHLPDILQLWMKPKLPPLAATPQPSQSGDFPGVAGASPGSGLLVEAAIEGPSSGRAPGPITCRSMGHLGRPPGAFGVDGIGDAPPCPLPPVCADPQPLPASGSLVFRDVWSPLLLPFPVHPGLWACVLESSVGCRSVSAVLWPCQPLLCGATAPSTCKADPRCRHSFSAGEQRGFLQRKHPLSCRLEAPGPVGPPCSVLAVTTHLWAPSGVVRGGAAGAGPSPLWGQQAMGYLGVHVHPRALPQGNTPLGVGIAL